MHRDNFTKRGKKALTFRGGGCILLILFVDFPGVHKIVDDFFVVWIENVCDEWETKLFLHHLLLEFIGKMRLLRLFVVKRRSEKKNCSAKTMSLCQNVARGPQQQQQQQHWPHAIPYHKFVFNDRREKKEITIVLSCTFSLFISCVIFRSSAHRCSN